MRIDVEAFGHDRVARRLRDLEAAAANPAIFLRRAARILLEETRERFARSPWEPLDADTIRRKTRTGQDPRVLRATGRLERALTAWGAPGQRLDFGTDELVFGLQRMGAAYYGRFHQTGRGVPRREMLKVTQRLRERLREALREHLLDRRV